ncbi:MAG TPA: hypothetical protein VF704_06730 [Allosphingosinicella sp.]
MPVAPPLHASQTVNTQLTPNCNARTEATFDINDTTWVTFYFQDSTPLWRTLLSVAAQQVILSQSITAVGITLQQGLSVTLNPMGSFYTVLLYGVIVDSGTSYRFDGLPLGTFSREAEMKLAVQSIRIGRISGNRQLSAAGTT